MATKSDYRMKDMGEAEFEPIELNGVKHLVGKHDALFPTGERVEGFDLPTTVKILQDAGYELCTYNVADAILTDELYRESELRKSFINNPIWLGAVLVNAVDYSLLLERPYVKRTVDKPQLAGFRKASPIQQLETGYIVDKDPITRYPTQVNVVDTNRTKNKLWTTEENGVFGVERGLWGNGYDYVYADYSLSYSYRDRGARPMKVVGETPDVATTERA